MCLFLIYDFFQYEFTSDIFQTEATVVKHKTAFFENKKEDQQSRQSLHINESTTYLIPRKQ